MPQFLQAILLGSLLSKEGGKKLTSMGIANVNQKDLAYLGELLEAGKITSVIDARYPLSETAEAVRYVEEKHAQGKVVITVV
jgi:NADPH:quinone reductase-like Zn-dependent oxidoreductase